MSVALQRSLLALLPLLAACADPAPPQPARVPPTPRPPASVAPQPPPPPPPLTHLRETWVHPCAFVGAGTRACELSAIDVAADGAFVVGGGSYAAVEFGGATHPKRAYEQLILAAFDATGRPLWSKAWGTIWHNRVSDARIIGDHIIITGVHGNGFSAGDKTMPDLPFPHVPGQDTAFEAEVGFVAAIHRDGKVDWARNLGPLAGGLNVPGNFPGLGYGASQIFPDAAQGFWLPYATPDGVTHVVHMVDGKVTEHRAQWFPKFDLISGSVAWIDAEGNVLRLAAAPRDPHVPGTTILLYRFDRTGTARATPVMHWPEPGPRDDATKWPLVQPRALLRVTRDGTSYVVIDVDETSQQTRKAYARLVRVDTRGYVTLDRPLFDPIVLERQAQDPVAVRSMHVADDGVVRILVNHRATLLFDGTRVDPLPLPALLSDPPGSTTLVTLNEGGATIRSVATLEAAPCIQHNPGSAKGMVPSPSGILFVGGARSSAPVAGCGGEHPRDGIAVRLDAAP